MPPYPVYLLALVLRRFAGRLPLSPAVKGNISDDPRVEAEDLGACVPFPAMFTSHHINDYFVS